MSTLKHLASGRKWLVGSCQVAGSLQQDGIQLACFVIEEVELLNGDRYELDLDGSLYELEPLCSSSARRGVRRVLGVVHSLRRMSTSSATQGMPKGFQ